MEGNTTGGLIYNTDDTRYNIISLQLCKVGGVIFILLMRKSTFGEIK